MIERLTDYFGEKYICIKGCKSLYENAERKGAPASNAIVRLAAYEDTGWSPEEISDGSGCYAERQRCRAGAVVG